MSLSLQTKVVLQDLKRCKHWFLYCPKTVLNSYTKEISGKQVDTQSDFWWLFFIWSFYYLGNKTILKLWCPSSLNGPTGFLTRSDTNQAVQPQKIARGFKLWRSRIILSHYVAKNKGVDQLRSYRSADLHLLCSHTPKAGFLVMRFIYLFRETFNPHHFLNSV